MTVCFQNHLEPVAVPMTENELLARYVAQDSHEDYDELVRRNTAMVYSVCSRVLGDASWEEPLSLGTANAVYIEDCTFLNNGPDGAMDGYNGARYVFRYNTLESTPLGHHGFDSGGYRSTFSTEIYNNKWTGSAWTIFHSRGGTGVIFGNRIKGQYGAFLLEYYRTQANYGTKWGKLNGSNPYDGNEDSSGYPARDQPGRSTDAGIKTPQLLEPVYGWNNRRNGREITISVHVYTKKSAKIMKENRDFYNNTKRPGYKPFTYPHPLRKQWPPLPPKDKQPPSRPRDLGARAISQTQVKLTWKASSDKVGVAGYYIWLNGQRVTTITDPTYTKYTFLGLKAPLSQYTFAISAFDKAGNESRPCRAVKVKRLRTRK